MTKKTELTAEEKTEAENIRCELEEMIKSREEESQELLAIDRLAEVREWVREIAEDLNDIALGIKNKSLAVRIGQIVNKLRLAAALYEESEEGDSDDGTEDESI